MNTNKKITLFGNDNILMRSYLFFLQQNKKYQIDVVLVPNLNKNKSGISKVKKINKNNVMENYFSNLNLKIPMNYWENTEIFNIFYDHFIKNYNIDIDGIDTFFKKSIRELDFVNDVTFYKAKEFNINTFESINFSINNSVILNTGSFIYTKTLIDNLKNNIFHIHPGYLPNLKGADGIFWSILKFDKIGMSLFKINEQIDEGQIYHRKYFNNHKLSNKLFDNFTLKEKYNLILSTIDPIFRSHFLVEFGLDSFDNQNIIRNSKGNYNTFMNQDELNNSFEKIFSS